MLLTAIAAGDDEPEDFRPVPDRRKVRIYDFKRPDKFNKEQIRTFSIIHETFARYITSMLSDKLRGNIHIHVASVDQLTYEEFIRSIPTPTTLALLNADPLKGSMVMEIDPAISFAMLHMITGGDPHQALETYHELTPLESLLMEEILVRMLSPLRDSWANILDFRPHLGAIETNPQFIQLVSPCEMTVLVTLEANVGGVEGMINLCIPYNVIEPIIDRLSAQFWYASTYKKTTGQTIKLLDDVKTQVIARYFTAIDTIRNVSNYKPGDFLARDKSEGTEKTGLLLIDRHVVGEFKKVSGYEKKSLQITKMRDYMEEDYMKQKHNVEITDGGLGDVRLQISVELGRTIHTLSEVREYGEGTIIELNQLAGEPVKVFANNVLIAHGEVVVIDENFGVRLLEIVAQDKPEKQLDDFLKETEEKE